MIDPPSWSSEELDDARESAIRVFRAERTAEPLEAYLEAFDDYQGVVEDLLETTVDLTDVNSTAVAILTDRKLREAFRYISGPPISEDDLKVVAEAALSASRIKADAEMVGRIVEVVLSGLDRRRFPWIAESREPTEAERNAAVLASAALLAMRKLETSRRSDEKNKQENRVENALLSIGFKRVPSRPVATLAQSPRRGEFCRESMLGNRKADFILGLWDRRIMAIECKVSNSSTNSVKRLNNDAAVKAQTWRKDFGERNVVPTAVLSGVYKLHNLEDAQRRGLHLFWAHDLQKMQSWIRRTRAR
jgi:XamI restriction endonuclease